MKKITLFCALFCALQLTVYSQYTAIPDLNFENRLIAIGVDSGAPDGQVLTANAEALTGTLTAITSSIVDMTGIEAFINITGLDVSYSGSLTSLNVSTISGLTSLNTIGCTSLASVNTTGLLNLTDLVLAGGTFTSLSLGTNAALQTLDVRQTALTALDLSSNPNLVSLLCNNSTGGSLTSLDLRNADRSIITTFDSDNNGSLLCIFVDDKTAGYLSGWSIDANSTFVDNEGECNTLTVESENQVTFNLYPNPANNSVNVNTSLQDSQIRIYDITGKIVLTKQLLFGNNTVDVSAISSGVYLAKIVSNSKALTKKLIIN